MDASISLREMHESAAQKFESQLSYLLSNLDRVIELLRASSVGHKSKNSNI